MGELSACEGAFLTLGRDQLTPNLLWWTFFSQLLVVRSQRGAASPQPGAAASARAPLSTLHGTCRPARLLPSPSPGQPQMSGCFVNGSYTVASRPQHHIFQVTPAVAESRPRCERAGRVDPPSWMDVLAVSCWVLACEWLTCFESRIAVCFLICSRPVSHKEPEFWLFSKRPSPHKPKKGRC